MVKSILGVYHPGLRDWLIQRVSAVILAIYSVFLVLFFLKHPDISYAEWHGLFSQAWMKILTLLVLVSLLFHAWVGMWTIFTDYIKIFVLRLVINVVVFLALVVFFFDGLLILWGV